MKILYTAEATATGGREGHVHSTDERIDLDLERPEELGGAGGPGTNPEQLFAAGFAGCFDNAMLEVARHMGLSTTGSRVTARVGLGMFEPNRYALEVELVVTLPELEKDEAESLVETTQKVCPFSNAVAGNIDVTHTVASSADV